MSTHRMHSLPDLVAAVPHLLGYSPTGLVTMGMDGHHFAGAMVYREPAEVLAADAQSLRYYLSRLVEAGADGAVLLAVDAPDGADLIDVASRACESLGMAVHCRAIITGGQVQDLDSGLAEPVPAASPALIEERSVARGGSPLMSREAVAQSFEWDGKTWAAVELARDGHALQEAVDAWMQVLDPHGEPAEYLPVSTVAKAASALLEIGTRDALLWQIVPGMEALGATLESSARTSVEKVPQTLPKDVGMVAERVRVMATHLSDKDAASTLTVAATLYWCAGDSTRAAIALERALRGDPTHRLARLTYGMVASGVRFPEAVPTSA